MIVKKFFKTRSLVWLSVLGVPAVVFIPVLSAGYVQWDDSLLINNLAVRGLGAEHLRQMMLPGGGAYQPVRDLYFTLIYLVSGFEPFGYHLANWLLNIVVVALAVRTAQVLCRRAGSAGRPEGTLIPWLAGLVFALHPLHVEVVAWMQGNKDLLASAFFLGAFLCWEKAFRAGQSTMGYYALSLLLFLLALGSKPSAVSFPLAVFALDTLLPGGNREKSSINLKSLLPRYLPILVPAALLTFYFVFVSGAITPERLNAENFLAIPLILTDYYRLLLLPVGLAHRYVDPVFTTVADPSWWFGVLITAALLYYGWHARKSRPLAAFGILWFYICWLPQSNLFPIAIRVADRYVFLSLFGAALAAVSLLVPALAGDSRDNRIYGRTLLAGTALALLMGALSWQRSTEWKDGVSLWGDAVELYPDRPFFRYGLGEAYLQADNLSGAREAFAEAARLDPRNARNWTSLAYAWKQEGNLEQAEHYYRKALDIDETSYFANNNLANVFSRTGRDSLAAEYYLRALRLRPGDYMASLNLASLYRKAGRDREADSLMTGLESGRLPRPVVLLQRGKEFIAKDQLDSARTRFERAVELDRNLMPAWAGLAEVYLRQDSTGKALETMRKVYQQSEPDWSLLNNMALAFERSGQPDSAMEYYRKAYRTEPDSVQSALNLAVQLNRAGKTGEAIRILRGVLEKNPGNYLALRNMGNWLAIGEENDEAARYYVRALEINPDDANVHYNLGRLYLQFLGRPREALHHLQESIRLEPNQQNAATIQQVVRQLEQALQ